MRTNSTASSEIAAAATRDLVVGEAHAHEPDALDLAGLRLGRDDRPRRRACGDLSALLDAAGEAAEAADEVEWIEVEEEIEEEVEEDVPAGAAIGSAGFQVDDASGIDDEIRDVFIEEVQEEIDNLDAQLPTWQASPDDLEQLKPIRRAFHTMKGSGRLVGALALGEFSWKVENMLNRVLDHSIRPGPQVVALVRHAIAALPGLLAALRGEGAPEADLGAIMDTADRLAAGELAELPAPKRGRRTVKRTVTRRVAVPKAPAAPAPEYGGSPRSHSSPRGADIVPGPLPGLDPVLFDILKSETEQHLGVVDDFLEQSSTCRCRCPNPCCAPCTPSAVPSPWSTSRRSRRCWHRWKAT